MRSFFLVFIANLFAATLAYSQSLPVSPDSTVTAQPLNARTALQQPTPATVDKTFGSRGTRVKINPLVFLSGDMPVYVEHEIKQNLSAEVSVGTTYDNVLSEAFENASQQSLNISKEGLNSVSFSAALRHYPSQRLGALQGYYFSPEVRFRDYRSQVNSVGSEPVNVQQSRQLLDGKFVIGYINQTNDHIFFDFYGGIGMRFKNYRNRIENYSVIYDPATNQTTTHLNLKDYGKRGLLLSLGFKVGFAF